MATSNPAAPPVKSLSDPWPVTKKDFSMSLTDISWREQSRNLGAQEKLRHSSGEPLGPANIFKRVPRI